MLVADEETSKLIQRVANEFNQLKFYVSKGSEYPFVKRMEHVRLLYLQRVKIAILILCHNNNRGSSLLRIAFNMVWSMSIKRD